MAGSLPGLSIVQWSVCVVLTLAYGKVVNSVPHTLASKGLGLGFQGDLSSLGSISSSDIDVHVMNATPALPTSGLVYEDVENRSQDADAKRFKHWLAETKTRMQEKGAEDNGAPRRGLNVFLPDDRIPLQNASILDEYPYRAVGLLGELKGRSFYGFCTGTIVSEWLVLTAGHCVQSTALSDLRILTGFVGGLGNYIVGFTSIVYEFNSRTDFALAVMEEPIGRYTGFPGIYFHEDSFFDKKRTLSMISYSGDLLQYLNAAAITYDCHSRVNARPFGVFHDCDATRGSSGSSVFTSDWYNCTEHRCFGDSCYCKETTTMPYVLGVNSYEFRDGKDTSLTVPEYSHQVANGFHPAIKFREAFVNMSRRSNQVYNCSQASSCSSCAAAGSGCGWCKEQQRCMRGDEITPINIEDRCEEWYFPIDQPSCEVIDSTPLQSECQSSSTCTDCTSRFDRSDCGWCSTTKKCVPGTALAPKASTCEQWDWKAPQCSCYNCPPRSTTRVRCPKSLDDCSCNKGFRKVISARSCAGCNSFKCPANLSQGQISQEELRSFSRRLPLQDWLQVEPNLLSMFPMPDV